MIRLPQSGTGLNDLLQMNKIRKKANVQKGPVACSLLSSELLRLRKPAAMLREHSSSPVEVAAWRGPEHPGSRPSWEPLGSSVQPRPCLQMMRPACNLRETLSQRHPAKLLLDFPRTVWDNTCSLEAAKFGV